ncbi:MAG: inorganic phosphate transporter, partial [Alphaproteobacteria bacterium]|nr:inorganic phosphate transporter [Alphaproteobacteria bacterium]
YRIVWAWSVSPFLIAGLSFAGMLLIRRAARRHPIPVLWRDFLTRAGLIASGCLAAYALGANNISVIAAPYLAAAPAVPPAAVWALACLAVCIGCWTADRSVMRTLASGLFPLSPVEACVAGLTMAATLMLFSSTFLRALFVQAFNIYVPIIPLPSSILIVGATIGIALAKEGYGLNLPALLKVFASWILIPVTTSLICYAILAILAAA